MHCALGSLETDIQRVIWAKLTEKTEKIIPNYSLPREYPILGVKSYSTLAMDRPIKNSITTINPWFITGFTDGEGCFLLAIRKNNKCTRARVGYRFEVNFQIELHKKDLALLVQIQKFFGVGKINSKSRGTICYLVSSIKDLQVIKDHFDCYPLITQKRADYELWKRIVEIMKVKRHLTLEGVQEIMAIKASMNNGLSNELKTAFLNTIIPVERPKVSELPIGDIQKHPHWLAGFTEAEGCFHVEINQQGNCKLRFTITQHSKDIFLLENLRKIFNCGAVRGRSLKSSVLDLKVSKFSDIYDKVLPIFSKYPLRGAKKKDFQDFYKVAELIYNKEHLTEQGLSQIRKLKSGMNRGR